MVLSSGTTRDEASAAMSSHRAGVGPQGQPAQPRSPRRRRGRQTTLMLSRRSSGVQAPPTDIASLSLPSAPPVSVDLLTFKLVVFVSP